VVWIVTLSAGYIAHYKQHWVVLTQIWVKYGQFQILTQLQLSLSTVHFFFKDIFNLAFGLSIFDSHFVSTQIWVKYGQTQMLG